MKMIYRPTVLTLFGAGTTLAAISGTTGYILGRAPSIPGYIPVHFDDQAQPTDFFARRTRSSWYPCGYS